MPRFANPEQMAYEAQQRAELQALEDAKDAHYRRLNNPLIAIVARLEQLETKMEALCLRLAAAEAKPQRNSDDW